MALPAAAVSAWRDPERWSALREPAGCPICRDGPFDVVAELESSWVTMGERSPVYAPGEFATVRDQVVFGLR